MAFTVFRQGTEIAGGRYVLERRLGSGGMATVWLATDQRLKRPVAIKIPTEALLADESWARRFEREAQTAASLSHPNLVSVYDFGSEEDRPFLVSEYVDGPTLEKLRQDGQTPPTEKVAESLLAALAHIHAAGIVHRDVKPGNVLVEGWDRILLTDFGIAQSTEETRLTNTGHVVGTMDFMAPEVKRGDRATPASDLYSCGVVLRELLSPGEPAALGALVERLTAEEPGDRPPSAEAALALLEGGAAATEEPPTSRMPTAAAPVPAPRSPQSVLGATPAADPPTAERPVTPPEPPPEPPRATHSGGRDGRTPLFALGVLAAIVAAIVIAVIALGSGGDGGEQTAADGGGAKKEKKAKEEEPEASTVTSTTTEPAPEPETSTVPAEVASGGDDPEAGIALNDEGYALLQAGDVEGALPRLEQSVASFPEDSTDINYAYALFNYGQALRMSGDPAAAIPYLEKRLAISNYKRGVVQQELELAQAEAGETDD